jgi:hypothetical protein
LRSTTSPVSVLACHIVINIIEVEGPTASATTCEQESMVQGLGKLGQADLSVAMVQGVGPSVSVVRVVATSQTASATTCE